MKNSLRRAQMGRSGQDTTGGGGGHECPQVSAAEPQAEILGFHKPLLTCQSQWAIACGGGGRGGSRARKGRGTDVVSTVPSGGASAEVPVSAHTHTHTHVERGAVRTLPQHSSFPPSHDGSLVGPRLVLWPLAAGACICTYSQAHGRHGVSKRTGNLSGPCSLE